MPKKGKGKAKPAAAVVVPSKTVNDPPEDDEEDNTIMQLLELCKKHSLSVPEEQRYKPPAHRVSGDFWVLYRKLADAREPGGFRHEIFPFEMTSREQGELAMKHNKSIAAEPGWQCVLFKDTPYMNEIDNVLMAFAPQTYDVAEDIKENEKETPAAPADPPVVSAPPAPVEAAASPVV